MQDETYIGTLVQGKQGTPHYKIKQMEQRPSSEWIRVPDAHEPLIAKQDFELVQRIRRLDTRTSPKQDTVYLFSGVLICGCCGSRMTRKTNRVKGKEYHYYYCPTGKKHGCANPVMLKESDLVECVKDSLKGYIDNVSCLQAILDGIDQSSINQALANEYASHIAANEQQVEQALEFKARLYESLITGTISKEEYTDYKAKYTRIAENAKESIRVLKEKLADVLENRSERNRWISHFTQFSTMETLDRKAVVHMIQSTLLSIQRSCTPLRPVLLQNQIGSVQLPLIVLVDGHLDGQDMIAQAAVSFAAVLGGDGRTLRTDEQPFFQLRHILAHRAHAHAHMFCDLPVAEQTLIAAGILIGIRRNIQRPKQRLIDGKAENGNYNGGRQRQEKQHPDGVTLSRLVTRSFVLGNQNAPTHGQANTEGIDDKAQHRGIADGGQAGLPHKSPHYQHIHHIVEGLQQVGQKQREGEPNQFLGYVPGQKILSLDHVISSFPNERGRHSAVRPLFHYP